MTLQIQDLGDLSTTVLTIQPVDVEGDSVDRINFFPQSSLTAKDDPFFSVESVVLDEAHIKTI